MSPVLLTKGVAKLVVLGTVVGVGGMEVAVGGIEVSVAVGSKDVKPSVGLCIDTAARAAAVCVAARLASSPPPNTDAKLISATSMSNPTATKIQIGNATFGLTTG